MIRLMLCSNLYRLLFVFVHQTNRGYPQLEQKSTKKLSLSLSPIFGRLWQVCQRSCKTTNEFLWLADHSHMIRQDVHVRPKALSCASAYTDLDSRTQANVNFSKVKNSALNKLAYNIGSKVDLEFIHKLMFQAGVKAYKE